MTRFFHLPRARFRLVLLCAAVCLIAACSDPEQTGEATPFPTGTPAPTATPAPKPTATGTPAGTVRHEFEPGGFSLLLPSDWIVAAQGETPLGHHFLLGPEPIGPGPASSAVFVAGGVEHSPLSIAEALLCGEGCAEDIELEASAIAGLPAQRVILVGDDVALTWHFLESGDMLIVFSLHDPETLSDRADLLESIMFDHVADSIPTESETRLPEPALEPVRSWRRVTPEDIALSFEAPATWTQDEGELAWRPQPASPFSLGFQVVPAEAGVVDPEMLFDDVASVEAGGTVELEWAEEGTNYTLSTADGWETLVVVPTGEQTIVFRAGAPGEEELKLLEPLLDHMVNSVQLDFVIEEFIPEPSGAAIGFFQALISDPEGDDALPFLSPELRETVPDGESPEALLQLGQRLLEYNLDWEYITDDTVLVTVQIMLADGSEVTRELLAVNLEDLGWRISEIRSPAESG